MDGGAWQVHGVTKSQTRLSDFTYCITLIITKRAISYLYLGGDEEISRSERGWQAFRAVRNLEANRLQ